MQFKKAFLAAIFCTFSLVSLVSRADTLTLVNSGGQTVGNESIYPYNFSVNGSSTLTPLICLDQNRVITFGQTWNVYVTGLPLDNSTSSNAYRTDAWILSQLGKTATDGSMYSNADVQLAVWDIFDPTDAANLGLTSNALELVSKGGVAASNSSLLTSGFFSRFTLYTPVDNTASDYTTGSVPQRFIGAATAVTPEPSSFLLFSTGLLSAGSLAFRRKLAWA